MFEFKTAADKMEDAILRGEFVNDDDDEPPAPVAPSADVAEKDEEGEVKEPRKARSRWREDRLRRRQ